VQDRNLDAEPIGASDEVAKDVVGLGRASVLDIVQHRRGGVGADLGVVAAVKLDDRGRRRVSLGGRDSGGFVERRSDEGCPGGCDSDLTGAGPGQRRNRRGRGNAGELRVSAILCK
jgi:hypothetical protein